MMDGYHHAPEAVLRAAGAREEVFAPPPPPRGKAFGRLRVLTVADALAAPPRRYLLRGLVAPGELSLWWGAPKCGKSFLLLRLVYGLALGHGMWGREPARACRVLYVAAEGEGGFAARLLALRDVLGDANDAFRYIAQRVTVGPPSEDLTDVIRAAQDMGADLIVLDTLARTFGEGDENAARDMGGFVASVDQLRAETGAHVAVVHHGTKEGSSSRGSGALVGAADLIVKVARGGESEPNHAIVEAAKDDVDGAVLPFRLHVVDLPAGPDGEARRTCVAEGADPSTTTARARVRLTDEQELLLRDLRDLAASGQAVPMQPEPGMPIVHATTRAAVRARLIASGFFHEGELKPHEVDSSANSPKMEKPTNAGYRRENKVLEALKRKGLAGFNRHHAWAC
ncbi:AAA family ATPase [Dankookia rubra]|uniref:AAA family ATPase n=1 Tax=Dankookia rubra TaxID=1442381 RepID=A0A4R5QBY8_9PROT|nr:AAA family ATPase [Dankookia rubra]TDH59807.1 AAA family ATPase [Dankookia rubra]